MTQEAASASPVVFVVDDDFDVREVLKSLLESAGLRCEVFASTREFVERRASDAVSCLVLDVRMPGASGLDLQSELASTNIDIPIIFLTGHGDIQMAVKAMKAGAVGFLTKPVREQDLLDATNVALERDRAKREKDEKVRMLRTHFELLTDREREVLSLVITGMLNRQIADELKLSEVTVKVYRHSLMKKLGAKSVAELTQMADVLGVAPRGIVR